MVALINKIADSMFNIKDEYPKLVSLFWPDIYMHTR